MAISLNNHESRIKILESRPVTTFTCEQILDKTAYGNITLSKSMAEYELLFIATLIGSTWFDVFTIPYIVFKNIGPIEMGGTSSAIRIKYVNDTTVYTDAGWRYKIYGLKLYYSFSYNIIYKILRSKISRLYQIFTLLKQKECEVKWL